MANKIVGADGLTPEQIREEVGRGGKFVMYLWCVSVAIMTFRQGTNIYFVRAGENAVVKGLPWTLLSLFVGWWGFPWGLIYTPHALFVNLGGGKDVTSEVLASLAPIILERQAGGYTTNLPQNPW